MGLQCESADISTELPRFARQSKILKADHRERKLKLQLAEKNTRNEQRARADGARAPKRPRNENCAVAGWLTFPLTSENGVRKSLWLIT